MSSAGNCKNILVCSLKFVACIKCLPGGMYRESLLLLCLLIVENCHGCLGPREKRGRLLGMPSTFYHYTK